jgi:hypothetical protein
MQVPSAVKHISSVKVICVWDLHGTIKHELIVRSVTCETTRSHQTVPCLLLDFVDICTFKGAYQSFFITQHSETLKTAETSSPKLQKPSMEMKVCLSTGVNWVCHNEGSQFHVTTKTLIKPRSLEMSACSLDTYFTLKYGKLQYCLQDLSTGDLALDTVPPNLTLQNHEFFPRSVITVPVPVAAPSKAYLCGPSPAEIVSSNPIGGMDICLLWLLCVVR